MRIALKIVTGVSAILALLFIDAVGGYTILRTQCWKGRIGSISHSVAVTMLSLTEIRSCQITGKEIL